MNELTDWLKKTLYWYIPWDKIEGKNKQKPLPQKATPQRSTRSRDRFGKATGWASRRDMDREKRLEKEFGRFSDKYTSQMDDQWDYWTKQRDRALSDWDRDRASAISAWQDPKWEEEYRKSQGITEGILSNWESILDKEQPFLRDIRDQQKALANELRDAPSTVEEQARIEHDRALESEIAMAGAFGGSLASNFASLSNKAQSRRGDVLRDTAGLRAQEYSSRIGQRAGLLDQAGGTSLDLANLGISDANVRSKVAEDLYRRRNIERGGEAEFLASLGAQNYNVMTGLGLQNVNVGTNLQGRASGILEGLGGVLDFGRSGDRLRIGDVYSDFGMAGNLEDREYNRFLRERAYSDMKEREADQRRSGMFRGLAKIGLPLLGTAVGGPAGGAVGSGLANMFGGESRNNQYTIPYIDQGNIPAFRSQPFETGQSGFSRIFGAY